VKGRERGNIKKTNRETRIKRRGNRGTNTRTKIKNVMRNRKLKAQPPSDLELSIKAGGKNRTENEHLKKVYGDTDSTGSSP
jgi:hypothetical protein